MKKQKLKYTVKIYNNIGQPCGELKFNRILEALKAYSGIKRCNLFMGAVEIDDQFILFAMRVISLIRLENPEIFSYEKENKINMSGKVSSVKRNKTGAKAYNKKNKNK